MQSRKRIVNVNDLGLPLEEASVKPLRLREDVFERLGGLNSKRGAASARAFLASGLNEDLGLAGGDRFIPYDFEGVAFDRRDGVVFFADSGAGASFEGVPSEVGPRFRAFGRKLEGMDYPKDQTPRGYIYSPVEGALKGALLIFVHDIRDRDIVDHEKAHCGDPNLFNRSGHNLSLGEMIVDLAKPGVTDWGAVEDRILGKYVDVWTRGYSPASAVRARADVDLMVGNCRRLVAGDAVGVRESDGLLASGLSKGFVSELLSHSLTVHQFNETAARVLEGGLALREAIARNMRSSNLMLLRRR